MATGRIRTLLLITAFALGLSDVARADVQLEDLPRPMATSEPGLDQTPIDDQPILSDGDSPGVLGNLRGGSRFSGGGYPSPQDPTGSLPYLPPQAECYGDPWTWQLMPQGVIYHSYLAGPKEPRMSTVWQNQSGSNGGPMWDPTVGARLGLFRYGTPRGFRPDGWELDIEGAAMAQLMLDHDRDLQSVDFRGGVPLTYGLGPFQAKFGYYHLSSHIGDEFFIKNPTFNRLNFSRDCLLFGIGYFATDNIRVYGEVAWAFQCDGGSQPWEFQFGAEYSPINHPGWRGDPFAAINAHLRQEVDFGGSLVIQFGWQWLSVANGSRLRTGFQYFNGKNEQYQFYFQYIQQLGYGVWYDF